MPYWRLFYHLVWATKGREWLLTPDVEPRIHALLRSKAVQLKATAYAVGGMPDHVHLVVAIPPSISVATFVGQVKATAATLFNKSSGDGMRLYWQREYGAFSFDGKSLAQHIAYVESQAEHHAQQSLIPILERLPDRLASDPDGPQGQPTPSEP